MDCSLKEIVFVAVVLTVCVLPGPCASQQFQGWQHQRGQDNPPRRCNTCQPYWISMLQVFESILTPRVMNRVCPEALSSGFISRCNTTLNTCSNSTNQRVNFCCCPTFMLPVVPRCFTQNPPDNICIPDSYAPWADQLQRIIFSGGFGK